MQVLRNGATMVHGVLKSINSSDKPMHLLLPDALQFLQAEKNRWKVAAEQLQTSAENVPAYKELDEVEQLLSRLYDIQCPQLDGPNDA